MNDKEILAGAPEGAVCVDAGNDYFNEHGVMWAEHCKCFDFHDRPEMPCRSLSDIRALVEKDERIKELEKEIEAHERNDAANYKIMNTTSKEISELELKVCSLDLTKGHLAQCEAALIERDNKVEELEKAWVNVNKYPVDTLGYQEARRVFEPNYKNM